MVKLWSKYGQNLTYISEHLKFSIFFENMINFEFLNYSELFITLSNFLKFFEIFRKNQNFEYFRHHGCKLNRIDIIVLSARFNLHTGSRV